MSEFKREGRYVVIKLKHMNNEEKEHLNLLLSDYEKYFVDSVVVESGWPIYEQTWDAIQRLSENKPQLIDEQQKQIDELKAKLVLLEVEYKNAFMENDEYISECAFKKGFWAGFEIARMNPDSNDIQTHWFNANNLRKQGGEALLASPISDLHSEERRSSKDKE